MANSSSNVFLFFGEDDFSLRKKIEFWKDDFAKKYTVNAIAILDSADLSTDELIGKLKEIASPSLFSSKKLIILKDCLPTTAAQSKLADFILGLTEHLSKDFFLIFWQQQKLDKRLASTKKILASKIELKEFNLPHGRELNNWIKQQAQDLNLKITDDAIEKLAVYVGRDLGEEKKFGGRIVEVKEAFDLWQVYSELLKLSNYSNQITAPDVEKLVKAKVPDSVFALTDQILAKNKKGAFEALENLLSYTPTEEKNAMIKVLGLLAENLRGLIIVASLNNSGLTDGQIAEKLGWTPGRVFITKKNSKNLQLDKLKGLLAHLLDIDYKLKSTSQDPKLLIDLFLVRATN
jgi:DNA polymerase III subunit delta